MKKAAYLASALLGVIWGSNFMGSVGLPTFLNRKASAAAKSIPITMIISRSPFRR